jgi:hypothetical protein
MSEVETIVQWGELKSMVTEMQLQVTLADQKIIITDPVTRREACCDTTEAALLYMKGLRDGKDGAEAATKECVKKIADKWRKQATGCPREGWQASILNQLAKELEDETTF